MTAIGLAFMTGLAGSGHCLGMCGGIVASFSAGEASRLKALFFNLGRITTYVLLGFAAGLAGEALDLLLLRPFATAVFVAGNLFVAGTGIFLLARQRFPEAPERLADFFRLLVPGRLPLAGSAAGCFPVGMLFGFIPCGLVYAPLAAAATTGDPIRGAAVMAALGAGTLPALFLAGSLPGIVALPARRWLVTATGGILVALGGTAIWKVFTL